MDEGRISVRQKSCWKCFLSWHAGNPILTSDQWPYPAHTVFNSGATLLKDGTTLSFVESRIAAAFRTCASLFPIGKMVSTVATTDPKPTLPRASTSRTQRS